MTVENLILEEIEQVNEQLKGMKPGSDEYKATADRLDRLMGKAIEMGRINLEAEQKEKQMEDDRQDRMVKNAIGVGGVVLPVLVTIWGTLKSLKFEETGTVTTIIGRGFISNLLRKK